MNSVAIKRAGVTLAVLTLLLCVMGSKLMIPMNIRFFLGAFGIGAGIVLVIVSNIVGLHRD